MKAGVVDIGTNSMRLLITDGIIEEGRWVEVTGLGRGVDATGRLAEEAMERTLETLRRFGVRMSRASVSVRRAVATSATRDADNRDVFIDRAEEVLGVRPEVIDGEREGALAYSGATADLDPGPRYLVSDIGGGSTEFVTPERVVSVDIGSVRLTDRLLADRPAPHSQLEAATDHVHGLFTGLDTLEFDQLVGVAGTWTSLAAIDLDLAEYDPVRVHHHRLTPEGLDGLVSRLAALSVEETARIAALDPARAPVILAGAVVARGVVVVTTADLVLVSERDTLDGLAIELLGLP